MAGDVIRRKDEVHGTSLEVPQGAAGTRDCAGRGEQGRLPLGVRGDQVDRVQAGHRLAGVHAFFTTTDLAILDTVAADKTHRHHAVIEQVHAALKHSALAHLPSGVFTANAAWLVLAVIAFNLTRAAASLTDPQMAKATTATIRRKLITVPARAATSARRITLHPPKSWPWQTAWTALFDRVSDPPSALAA